MSERILDHYFKHIASRGHMLQAFEVIIIGAGPAGLNAALILGRSRRKILVIDSDMPRNRYSKSLHGFVTRDGAPPASIREIGRRELMQYEVSFMKGEVIEACASPIEGRTGFRVKLKDMQEIACRKLLLATGLKECFPKIKNFEFYYGNGVYHCPYCDGWEVKDSPLFAIGERRSAVGLGLLLLNWSKDVTAFIDEEREKYEELNLFLKSGGKASQEKILALTGDGANLTGVETASGKFMPCRALFFNTPSYQPSPLAIALGCRVEERQGAATTRTYGKQSSEIPGLFVAGDADGDVLFTVVAASEGAIAAVSINKELHQENLLR